MTNPRILARLQARIHERVAYCIMHELADPRATFITVTRVELSPDLSYAKVYYSVLGSAGERSNVQHMLSGAAGFVQRQLGRVLETRKIPKLSFFYDESVETAASMDRAIKEAFERDRAINPAAHTEIQPLPQGTPSEDLVIEAEYNQLLDDQEQQS